VRGFDYFFGFYKVHKREERVRCGACADRVRGQQPAEPDRPGAEFGAEERLTMRGLVAFVEEKVERALHGLDTRTETSRPTSRRNR